MLTNTSPTTIENWKAKCGIKSDKKPPTSIRTVRQPREYDKVDRKIWNCKEWFQATYDAGFGIPAISQMTGISTTSIWHKLHKYGIKTRDIKTSKASRNPYCTAKWLTETYVDSGWTLRECAAIVEVSPHTITKWLAKFNIPSRDINESMAGLRNPHHKKKRRLESANKVNGNSNTGTALGCSNPPPV